MPPEYSWFNPSRKGWKNWGSLSPEKRRPRGDLINAFKEKKDGYREDGEQS